MYVDNPAMLSSCCKDRFFLHIKILCFWPRRSTECIYFPPYCNVSCIVMCNVYYDTAKIAGSAGRFSLEKENLQPFSIHTEFVFRLWLGNVLWSFNQSFTALRIALNFLLLYTVCFIDLFTSSKTKHCLSSISRLKR